MKATIALLTHKFRIDLKNGLATLLLLAGAFTSHAAFVTLTNSDASGALAATASFTSKGKWDSGASPATGNTYFVPNNFTNSGVFTNLSLNLRTPQDTINNLAFNGDQLILSGPGNPSAAGGRLVAKCQTAATATFWFTNSSTGIILTNYGMLQHGGSAFLNVFSGGILITNGGVLLPVNGPMLLGGPISGNGPLWIGSPSAASSAGVTLMGNIANFTGAISATNSTSSLTFSNGLTQTLSGNLLLNNNLVTVQGAGGVLTMAGNNIYGGATTISSGTTLILTGNNTGVTNNTTINGTLQLQANGGNTVSGTCYALGSLATATNRLNNGGALQLRSDSGVLVNGGSNLGGVGSATVTFDVNQLTGAGANNILFFSPGGFNTATTAINVTGGNGYSLALGALNSLSGTLTLNPSTANVSVGGITGTLTTMTKNGTGKLTLTVASTYVGSTLINTGTVALAASAMLASTNILVNTNGTLDVRALGSALTLASGTVLRGYGNINGSVDGAAGAIYPGIDSGAGTLTITTNLTLSGSGSVNFDIANNTTIGGGTNDLLVVGGNVAITGATAFNLKFLNGSPATGTYTLIQCASISTDLSLVTLPTNPRYTFALTTNVTGTAIQLVVNGIPANLVWHGDGTANIWDNAGGAQNWFNGASPDYFYDGDIAAFTNIGSNSPSINLGSTVSPSSVTVNSTINYDFAGAGQITSPGSLTKNGNSTLILESPNSYSGGIVINVGTLQIGNAGSVGSLTGSISNNAALVVNETGGVTLASAITGSGTLTQAGSGSTTLTASNSYSGATTVSTGILYVQNNDALGSTANGTTVANGAQLYIVGNTPNIGPEPLSLAGTTGSGALRKGGATTTAFGGAVTLAADTLISIDASAALNFTNASSISGNNLNLNFTGSGNSSVAGSVVLGTGVLTKSGTGTVSLNASNNYSGGTTLGGGTLNVAHSQALGSGLININGTAANDVRLALTNGIAITNAIIFNSGKTYTSGAIYLLGSTSVASIAGTVTANGVPSSGGLLGTDAGTGYLELLGPFNSTLGAGGVLTVRTGNVRFSGGGDAQDGLIRNDTGTASLGATNGMPTNAVLTLGANGAGVFDLNGFNQNLESVIRWDASASHSGVVLNNNSLKLATLTLNPPTGGSTSTAVFSSGAGILNLTKVGAETLTLSAKNTYTGTTVVHEGTLALGATGSISNSVSILVASNATFDVSAVTGGFTVAAGQTLKGIGTVIGNAAISGTLSPGESIGTLTFNNNLTLSGITSIEINKGLNTNDQVLVVGSVTYGGTLSVTNLAGTLTTNDTFVLFSPGTSASNFTNIIGSPGAGLAYGFTNGVLSVVTGIATNPTNITSVVNGGNLELTWPVDHTGWTLQVQTNSLSSGLGTNWVNVTGSTSVNSVTNPIAPANGSVFYRLVLP